MTPEEVKAAREGLGLTQRGLETYLGLKACDGRTVRRWEDPNHPTNITGPCQKLIRIFQKKGLDVI